MVFEADGAHLWTAAFASDRVAKVAAESGAIVSRVDVRPAGASTDEMRGPRGLALHPVTGRLYVLNKLRESISVVDTLATTPAVNAEVSLSAHEPLPAEVKAGRGYLFDARLSGNGLVSCGICHIDADRDGLAWDLGVPDGALQTVLGANLSVHDTTPRTRVMHPMKGPMTTQTLRGLEGGAPFHWRGDKPGIADFNPTSEFLMVGSRSPRRTWRIWRLYLMTLRHHPNPNRNLDRTLPATLGERKSARRPGSLQQPQQVPLHHLPRLPGRIGQQPRPAAGDRSDPTSQDAAAAHRLSAQLPQSEGRRGIAERIWAPPRRHRVRDATVHPTSSTT